MYLLRIHILKAVQENDHRTRYENKKTNYQKITDVRFYLTRLNFKESCFKVNHMLVSNICMHQVSNKRNTIKITIHITSNMLTKIQ